jgi:TRAP-type mannitol/chloroaromatic compound transport system substrate-binding protein
MERRTFLRTAGLAAIGTAAGCGSEGGAAPAVHTGKRVKWRLVSSFPRSLDTIFGAAEVMAKRVEEMSGGQFTIRVHPAGELVPALSVLDAVQQGTAQIGHTAGYYYTGKHKALAFDTCVPFGLTARQQAAWLLEAGGLELVREVYAGFGVRSFPGGNTGVQMGGWWKREVASKADLAGLKMRIPGMGGEVMARLGVTVQVLPGGEIYPALERGVIDATDWVGPYDDEKLGFHKVAPFYHYPGWWEPGPSLSFLANEAAFADLPAEYQAIFSAACADAARVMQTRYDAKNPAAMQRILAYGTSVLPFPDDVMVAAQQVSRAVLEEQAAADPLTRKIYEHFRAFQTASQGWFGTAELAYARFAARA